MQAVEELNASSAQITALLKARQAERAAARAAAAAAAAQQSAPSYSWVQGSSWGKSFYFPFVPYLLSNNLRNFLPRSIISSSIGSKESPSFVMKYSERGDNPEKLRAATQI